VVGRTTLDLHTLGNDDEQLTHPMALMTERDRSSQQQQPQQLFTPFSPLQSVPLLPANRPQPIAPASAAYAKRSNIYDRNLNRTRGTDSASQSSFAFLFSEMVRYAQKSSAEIAELEGKLSSFGYRVGHRCLELYTLRDQRNAKRETRILGILQYIYSPFWKSLFGRAADALERSRDHEDEYMIYDNDPMVNTFISVPKEMAQLNCAAFVAGMIEAVLDDALFPSRVTAHTVAIDGYPNRTVYLIKLDETVSEREMYLK